MKPVLLLASLIGAAIGQLTAADFPPCTTSCFTDILTKDGCAASDFQCHCSVSTLYTQLKTCVDKVCDAVDENVFLNAIATACSGLGEPLKDAPVSSASTNTSTVTASSATHPAGNSSTSQAAASSTASHVGVTSNADSSSTILARLLAVAAFTGAFAL